MSYNTKYNTKRNRLISDMKKNTQGSKITKKIKTSNSDSYLSNSKITTKSLSYLLNSNNVRRESPDTQEERANISNFMSARYSSVKDGEEIHKILLNEIINQKTMQFINIKYEYKLCLPYGEVLDKFDSNKRIKSLGEIIKETKSSLKMLDSEYFKDHKIEKKIYMRAVLVNNDVREKTAKVPRNKEEYLNKIHSHIAGKQGRAPSDSPFFSCTTDEMYVSKFANFLRQYGDVLVHYLVDLDNNNKFVKATSEIIKCNLTGNKIKDAIYMITEKGTLYNTAKSASEHLIKEKIEGKYIIASILYGKNNTPSIATNKPREIMIKKKVFEKVNEKTSIVNVNLDQKEYRALIAADMQKELRERLKAE